MRSVVPPHATLGRPHDRTVVALDGSDVRVLLSLAGGGMAEFELAAGRVSADRQPFRALTLTPSTILRLATRNTISNGSALRTAPAMIGPYDSAA
jgi:hypothetical protein